MIAFKRHPHLSMQLSEAGKSVPFCGQRRNSKKPLWFAVIWALTLAHWGKWLGMIIRNTPLVCHKHRDLLWQHQDYLTLLIGSDDLTLSKRAPPLTIARLQKFFSSDFDLLFFSISQFLVTWGRSQGSPQTPQRPPFWAHCRLKPLTDQTIE